MSEPENLRDIGEVNEERSYIVVNLYLDAGWELLSTRIIDQGEPRQPSQATVYVLGWPRAKGEAPHPSPEAVRGAMYSSGKYE